MPKKSFSTITIIIVSVLICIVAAFLFYKQFSTAVGDQTFCLDAQGELLSNSKTDTAAARRFRDCLMINAKLYLEKDYEISKDLSKSFLTLMGVLLVASITFSEKIVGLATTSGTARTLMITCWFFLLAAILTCGVGLAFMTIAAGEATYAPLSSYRDLEVSGALMFICAGFSFGGGMVSLLIAGIISIKDQKSSHYISGANNANQGQK